jgi:DNA recombination protein RmuC
MNSGLLLFLLLAVNAALLVLAVMIWRRSSDSSSSLDAQRLAQRLEALDQSLGKRFTDVAVQIEGTRGALDTAMAQKLSEGLNNVRGTVESQLAAGRDEQSATLNRVTQNLEAKFDVLATKQSQAAQESRAELTKSIEAIRGEIDRKLLEITGNVQQKLDQNIKEGFSHFEKVQEHLRNASEQLKNVGTLGNSIHDLNNLLKLPHLRGKFGELSLERLLQDFLPPQMYTLQMGPEGSSSRADAMIHFPDRNLPIDAKFPREQVLALFEEGSDAAEIEEARKAFGRVLKEQAKRVKLYIQPENGTTDMALLYLPSETLYMEAVRNRDLWEELGRMKVFPASPNTLLVTLQSISMVHKWFELQKGLASSLESFNKAQKSMEYFEAKFTVIGKSLEKAQDAFSTASTHLKQYKTRVSILTENEALPLFNGKPALPEVPTDEDDEEKEMSAKA